MPNVYSQTLFRSSVTVRTPVTHRSKVVGSKPQQNVTFIRLCYIVAACVESAMQSSHACELALMSLVVTLVSLDAQEAPPGDFLSHALQDVEHCRSLKFHKVMWQHI